MNSVFPLASCTLPQESQSKAQLRAKQQQPEAEAGEALLLSFSVAYGLDMWYERQDTWQEEGVLLEKSWIGETNDT